MKPLLPTLKEDKRYLTYDLGTSVSLTALDESVRESLGCIQAARAGFSILDHHGRKGILRVAREAMDSVRTCLMLITEIQQRNVQPRVTGVSGTLDTARTSYMEE